MFPPLTESLFLDSWFTQARKSFFRILKPCFICMGCQLMTENFKPGRLWGVWWLTVVKMHTDICAISGIWTYDSSLHLAYYMHLKLCVSYFAKMCQSEVKEMVQYLIWGISKNAVTLSDLLNFFLCRIIYCIYLNIMCTLFLQVHSEKFTAYYIHACWYWHVTNIPM